jgi:predicted nuclease of predicted toxin-antitoxin system
MAEQAVRLYIPLYFDENIASQFAYALRKDKYDVVTAREAGMLGKSDEEQLDYAVTLGRTILTHDRDDYTKLHNQYLERGQDHYGIIILIVRPQRAKMLERLLAFLNEVTADEMGNQLRFA